MFRERAGKLPLRLQRHGLALPAAAFTAAASPGGSHVARTVARAPSFATIVVKEDGQEEGGKKKGQGKAGSGNDG